MPESHISEFSPASASPQIGNSTENDSSQYLTELLAEHQKFGPFMPVLPLCSKLLNQAIMRVSCIVTNIGFGDHDKLRNGGLSPMVSSNVHSNGGGISLNGQWNGLSQESLGGPQGMIMDWQGAAASPSSHTVRKFVRMDIPEDSPPAHNFLGRFLGPRGIYLKQLESITQCRVYIRGKGSVKDPGKEEELRGEPGYEHLNEPLHILVQADLPANIIDANLQHALEIIQKMLKPMDGSQDFYKMQRLQKTGQLNTHASGEESHTPSCHVSTYSRGSRMKRPNTWQ